MAFSAAPVMRNGGFPVCDAICAPMAESGVMTRSMGRRESDSSPDHFAGKFLPRHNAAQHAHRGTGVAAIERTGGSGERQAASLALR